MLDENLHPRSICSLCLKKLYGLIWKSICGSVDYMSFMFLGMNQRHAFILEAGILDLFC